MSHISILKAASAIPTTNSYSFIIVIALMFAVIFLFSRTMKKLWGSIILFAVVFAIFIAGVFKGSFVYPGLRHVIIQVLFLAFIFTVTINIAFNYRKITKKEKQDYSDILNRKKYVNYISIIMAIGFPAIPFIYSSWGFPFFGSIEPSEYVSYDIVLQRFINNGLKIGLIVSVAVFLADSILSRLATTVLTAKEANLLDKFCLYLRSFSEDNNKEEKKICEVINTLYPIYAIGDPNSVLQPNGAERIYLTDEEWQNTVSSLSSRSKLILLRIGQTAGTSWEITYIINAQLLTKTIFVVYSKSDFQFFSSRLLSEIGRSIPLFENIENDPYAFFWSSDDNFHHKRISKDSDVSGIINEFVSQSPDFRNAYEKDVQIRKNAIKYIFNKKNVPSNVRKSLNWGIISPVVNMRHWPLSIWCILFLTMIIAVMSQSVIPVYVFCFFAFLIGNRIEWIVGSWSCSQLFLKKQRREALLLITCSLLGALYSLLYIYLAGQ